MVVAFEGFSIREYTAKMRSVDVAKCWPFFDNAAATTTMKSPEEVEALLPPITVAKFRWWSHELRRLRSKREKSPDEKSEMVCPVCRVFAASTVNAVNAHIDECLSGRSSSPPQRQRPLKEERRQVVRRSISSSKGVKPKSKPPKKRSIAEIFAVAPQIETIESSEVSEQEDEDEDEDEDDEGEEVVVDDSKVMLSVSRSNCGSGSGSSVLKAKKKNSMIKKRKKEKKEKKRGALMEKEDITSVGVLKKLKESKKLKKKVMKKMKNLDGSNSLVTKVSAQKFKLQNHMNFAKRLKRRFPMDILNSDSVYRKKTSLKCLCTYDKQKQKVRNEEPAFPIRSILKNHTSGKQKSVVQNMQCGSEANPCGIQLSERHVRFSGKDDILGPKRKGFCSSEQNFRNLLSDALAASSEMVLLADNNTVAAEVKRNEVDTSVATDCGTEVQTILGWKQLPEIPHVEIPSSMRLPVSIQDTMKLLPGKSTVPLSPRAIHDDNVHMLDQGYPTAPLKHGFTGVPRLFSTFGGSCENTQVGGNVRRTFSSSGKLMDHVLDPIHKVAETRPMVTMRPFSEPLSVFAADENANHRLHFQSQPAEEKVGSHMLCYQQFCHMPPVNLIGGLCSFPEWKHKAVASRERTTGEDFFGLPLNSHGELIQSSSRSKGTYCQPRETNITGPSSSFFPERNLTQPRITGDYLSMANKHSLEREFPNDEINVFLAQNYVKENSSLQLPARLGVTYWESTGRADIHQLDFERSSDRSFRPLDADLRLMNTSFDGRKEHDHVQNKNINEMIHLKESSGKMPLNTSQPTMRLMGKDVAIGKSSKELQGFEDGKFWTDKEIIVEHCPSGAGLDGSSLNRNFQEWIPRKCKETMGQSLEIQCEKSTQNKFPFKAPESGFAHPYIDWDANSFVQSSSLAANRNSSANSLPFARLPTSSTVFNRASNFQDFFISESESLRLNSQLSLLSSPQNSWEHVDWRPAELTPQQNLPHFTKQRFEFPFLTPDSRANAQSSWFQNSTNLPSWLLHSKQQGKTPMISSQPIPNAVSKQHQHISSRTNFLNTPSVYHSAEATSYPCNTGGNSNFQVKSSLDSAAAIVLPPIVPVITSVKPASAVNAADHRNRLKVKERLKSKALGVKDLYPYKKTNKRHVTKSVDLVKPSRILDSEKQAKLSDMARCTENTNSEIHCDHMAEEGPHSQVFYSSETQSNGIRISGNESSRVDCMGRPGPMKLSAGAKHILKPNQTMDPVNFMPIHSTIPFAAVPNASKVPESQKKAMKIYRF
ncbi:hypothetical protein PanWU01x14_088490 [Parasponia andersonii]|uniref:UBZ4-type domain-containing protein n=1 Tax=Parasponia andersonii TaxID=3476 RepID=A0A2P5D826_PARAD|nr:hypothetical protein PanWU01x14_088490 [Parasponia andersonii]